MEDIYLHIFNIETSFQFKPTSTFLVCIMKNMAWPSIDIHKVVLLNNSSYNLFSCDYVENNFEDVLATFCCYSYGANTSEAVRKIDTD